MNFKEACPMKTTSPNRRSTFVSDPDKSIAELAYKLWLSSPFRGKSPEEALLAALEIVKAKAPARLFAVPKRERLPAA